MALGGGTFTAQNKVLPGAYINFVSLAAASATLSDRGIAAIGLELDWGASGIQEITNADFHARPLASPRNRQYASARGGSSGHGFHTRLFVPLAFLI